MRRSINQDAASRRRMIALVQDLQDSHAVVVLPPGMHGRVGRQDQRKWLSRGRLQVRHRAEAMFAGVLGSIAHALPAAGLAALRFWGQTGERSDAWIAAADPVHLEARLDHLCLHALQGNSVSPDELCALFEYLQKMLGDDNRFAFVSRGCLGYLRGTGSIATAAVSPEVLDGCPPDEFMPAGNGSHDQLLSELQMALHDHAVNLRRAAGGKLPVNSLWLWGGGTAPPLEARPIPALFADDPLFRGYWRSCGGAIESWKGDFEQCLDVAPCSFVAVTPDDVEHSQPAAIERYLEDLRRILQRRQMRRLTLLFRDGLQVEIQASDSLRFWRPVSLLLQEASDDG